MDDVRFLDSLRNAEIDRWVEQVVEARQAGHFCKWMTDVHPDHLSCQMEGDFLHGSFNLNQKVVFSDGTAWLLRLPFAVNPPPLSTVLAAPYLSTDELVLIVVSMEGNDRSAIC